MKMRKVYVPNKSGHDFSAAEKFGELVYVTEDWLPDRYAINTMWRAAREAMRKSSPEDYILLTGLSSLCCVCAAEFVHKHRRLNLLIHHKDGYKERTVVYD